MTPKELAYANWRLENPPMADTNVPKWIGLLVVARLAVRHGIRVRLQPADFGGLTAMIWLPDEVLTGQGAMTATNLGGFASAGSRRGMHEAIPDRGYATAQREGAAARFAPPPGGIRDNTLDRRSVPDAGLPSAEPRSRTAAGSAPRAGSHATSGSPVSERPEASPDAAPGRSVRPQVLSARSGTVGPPSHDMSSAAGSVVVPSAGGREAEQRLPVYNAVESHWFGESRSAPTSPGHAAATGNRWSSPADAGWRAASTAESPSSAGSTAAGLPRRQPNANLVPGTIPSAEPVMPSRSPAAARERLAALQRGVDKGRAAAGQMASPGEDEEVKPGSPD